MSQQTDTQMQRMSALRAKIEADRITSEKVAGRYLAYLEGYKKIATAFSVISVVLGLVGSIWKQVHVEPAVFSALAALTVGMAGLRQKFSWREQADTWYKRRDMLDSLLSRIDYQVPSPPTADQVAEMAKNYDAVREAMGKDLHAINAQEDAKWQAGPHKPPI